MPTSVVFIAKAVMKTGMLDPIMWTKTPSTSVYKILCDDFIISFFLSLFSNLDQSQHHDDEKRALSREIIVLNNHLMEAKLTIEKLQEDNVRIPFRVLLLKIK